MKKTYLLTLGLIGTLFLGCANKTSSITKSQTLPSYKPESKYSLYMPFNQFDSLEDEVNNKAHYKSLNLNTLKPVKLPKMSCKVRTATWGLLKSRNKCICRNFYQYEKSYLKSDNFPTIAVVGALTFGIVPALFGIPYNEYCILNEEKFNRYIINYLNQHNIDRKKLIDEYMKAVDNVYSKNKKLQSIYFKIRQKYINIKSAPMKKKYNDKTGFLSNHDYIDIVIKKHITMPQKPDLIKIINNAFPCTPMQGCLGNFSFANHQIDTTVETYINELKSGAKYNEFIKYSYNKNPHKYDNKNGKILYYNVTVNPQTDTAVYTIYRTDFYNAIPHYSIENSTIKVEELPNGEVKFTNLTNKFIDIDILSIYFKDRIINIPVNLQLAPHGEKNLYVKGFADVVTELNNLHERVDFKEFYTLSNITAKDKNKKITVGLAVKYKVAGSNKTNTLYNETKYPISKLIKDKI